MCRRGTRRFVGWVAVSQILEVLVFLARRPEDSIAETTTMMALIRAPTSSLSGITPLPGALLNDEVSLTPSEFFIELQPEFGVSASPENQYRVCPLLPGFPARSSKILFFISSATPPSLRACTLTCYSWYIATAPVSTASLLLQTIPGTEEGISFESGHSSACTSLFFFLWSRPGPRIPSSARVFPRRLNSCTLRRFYA